MTEKYTLTLDIKPLYHDQLGLYRYDYSKERWRNVNNETKSLPQINRKTTKIVSYNIWGALKDYHSPLFAFDMRAKALNEILKNEDADIMCLQEVSKRWLEFLLDQDWLKKSYYCTEKDGERVNTTFGLSNVIFSKLPLANVSAYGLISMQMDEALYVEIFVNNRKISLVTSQLHSLHEYSDFRIMQLKIIFGILLKNIDEAIFVGDYNFGDSENKWVENKHLDPSFKDGYRLLYPDVNKNPGFTEDTKINEMRYMMKKKHKQERFDKFMFKSKNISPIEFKIIGKEKIGSVKFEGEDIGIWPSDHFGISCIVKMG